MCDFDCGKPAPYVDVFKLRRLCLWTGGPCNDSSSVENISYLQSIFRKPVASPILPTDDRMPHRFDITDPPSVSEILDLMNAGGLSSFVALPKTNTIFRTARTRATTIYYDWAETQHLLASKGYVEEVGFHMPQFPGFADVGLKMCATFAPWIHVKGMGSTHGTFCETCLKTETQLCKGTTTTVRHRVQDLVSKKSPAVEKIVFSPNEWLKQHCEEKNNEK